MSAIAYVKQHPYLVGGAAIVIIGGALLIFGRNSGSNEALTLQQTMPTQDPSSVAAGQQIQAMNIAAQQAAAETLAAKEVSLATIAATTAKAQLEKDTAFHLADLAAATEQKKINVTGSLAQFQILNDRRLKERQLVTARQVAEIQALAQKRASEAQKKTVNALVTGKAQK